MHRKPPRYRPYYRGFVSSHTSWNNLASERMLATVLMAGLALGEVMLNLRSRPCLVTANPWSFGKYLLSGINTWFSISATVLSMHSIDNFRVSFSLVAVALVFAMRKPPFRGRLS